MNVGVAHSEVNPNTRVMNSRGVWLTYTLGVGLLHTVLLSIPVFCVPVAWTLTDIIHNLTLVEASKGDQIPWQRELRAVVSCLSNLGTKKQPRSSAGTASAPNC